MLPILFSNYSPLLKFIMNSQWVYQDKPCFTAAYDYKEVLRSSLLFYEVQ